MDDLVEKHLGEAKFPGRKFDKIAAGSKASIWIAGKKEYSGKITGIFGDGFRFKSGTTEIDIEVK